MYNLSIKRRMKKMKFLFGQLYLLALLTLPLVTSSCSDDDDPKVEISSLGIENGATINIGQVVQLEAQVSNLQGEVAYIWQVNGKDVSTESSYTFIPNEKGTYTITLNVASQSEIYQKSVCVTVQIYSSSFYVVNEGYYGNTPGSINRYKEGVWSNDIVQGLGYTTTSGIISDDYMYIVSKTTPFLVKMKLSDYSIVGSITEGDDNVLGNNGQGNNFCIVNEETGILTSTNGAFKVNLNPLTLGEKLNGMDEIRLDKEDICKAGNYIFIICDNIIKAYNANDLSFKKDINEATTGFAQTKDGALWAANENKLVKINVTSLTSEEFELPDKLNVYYNSSAYTPSGLSASTTENALYFAQKTGEGWSIFGKDIYKYNTETKTATKFFSAPAIDKSIYGAGIQVDPRNGDVYIIYTEDGWSEHYLNTNIYVADGVSGAQKSLIDYTGKYWFPSMIIFQ